MVGTMSESSGTLTAEVIRAFYLISAGIALGTFATLVSAPVVAWTSAALLAGLAFAADLHRTATRNSPGGHNDE